MDIEEINNQIEQKQKEINDLKYKLALNELVKDIQINQCENNILKDVKWFEYLSISGKLIILTFLLNGSAHEIKIEYTPSFIGRGLNEYILNEISVKIFDELKRVIRPINVDYNPLA